MSTEPRTFTGRTMIGVRAETRAKIQVIADANRWPLSTCLDVLADYWLDTTDPTAIHGLNAKQAARANAPDASEHA